MTEDLHERHTSLWWVAGAPAIWAVHFLASYGTAAVWCAKRGSDSPLSLARIAIAFYTLAALAALAVVAQRGLGRYRAAPPEHPGDADTREARSHFLGFTLLSLAGLSALAVIYEALAAVIIGSCR
jgi:hypothetical protein